MELAHHSAFSSIDSSRMPGLVSEGRASGRAAHLPSDEQSRLLRRPVLILIIAIHGRRVAARPGPFRRFTQGNGLLSALQLCEIIGGSHNTDGSERARWGSLQAWQ